MTLLFIVEIFSFFLRGGIRLSLSLFPESPFLSSECPVGFPIHFVGMSLGFFLLEIGVFVIPFAFLRPSSKVVVKARRRRDQVYPGG
jgi:hypothetical protein